MKTKVCSNSRLSLVKSFSKTFSLRFPQKNPNHTVSVQRNLRDHLNYVLTYKHGEGGRVRSGEVEASERGRGKAILKKCNNYR